MATPKDGVRAVDPPQPYVCVACGEVEMEEAGLQSLREITPEMMTEAAKRVGFDPVPGKLTRLAGVLNAMLAHGVDLPVGGQKP